MSTCKHCGFETAENSRFCSQCGKPVEQPRPVSQDNMALHEVEVAVHTLISDSNPESLDAEIQPKTVHKTARRPADYCKKCGAKLPVARVFCLICGTKAGEEPSVPEESAPPVTATFEFPLIPDASVRRAERKNSKLFVICAFISVLLALSAASVWLVQALPYLSAANKTKAHNAIVYISNGGLRFITPLLNEPEEIESFLNVEPAANNISRTSPNGQYIAYLKDYKPSLGILYSDPSTLYLRDFAKIPKRDSSEPLSAEIASGVTDSFFFTDNSLALVYLKSDFTLEFTDFNETRVIDNGVYEIIAHSDSLVLYSKQTSDNNAGVFDLYMDTVGSGAESTRKIAENVIELCDYSPSLDKLIYIRTATDGTNDLIGFDIKQNSEKTLVIGMAGDVIEADARTFSLLFQTSSPNLFRYDNIIDDDMLREDLRAEEPELEDYPLLNEFYDKYGIDADYEGSLYYEEIVDEKGRFEASIDAYAQKLTRDKLRDDINATVDAFIDESPLLYSLYLCLNGEVVKLADSSYTSFDNATLDVDKGYVIWPQADIRSLKRIPISEYEHIIGTKTLSEYLHDFLSQTLHLQKFGRGAVSLYVGDGPFHISGWQLTEKADGIYFTAGGGSPVQSHDLNMCSLYYASLEDGVAGSILQADENVFGVGTMLYGDRLLYYKNMSSDLCDLYIIDKNGIGERIGDDVAISEDFLKTENGGKTLFYFEHFNTSTKTGDLFMHTGQNRQIASDVSGVFYRTDTLVYFLRGLKGGKADLYSFGDDGLRLLDSNVTAVMK